MKKIYFAVLTLAITIGSCSKKDNPIDETPPVIDLTISGAFPQQCAVIKKGETFTFKARFTDNAALGSYGLDIHHNFDHHSHSTETEACEKGAAKTPVNPFLLVKNFTIPEGQTSYEGTTTVEVPAGVDTGDYHFMIKVTDKQGWQTLKGISIKIN